MTTATEHSTQPDAKLTESARQSVYDKTSKSFDANMVVVFLAYLGKLVTERHQVYADATALIEANFKKGERRNYGRPKLRLSVEDLSAHMSAIERRSQAQRELLVLVPVRRRVLAGLSQKGCIDIKKNPVLEKNWHRLTSLASERVGGRREIERSLALQLLNLFPEIFGIQPSSFPVRPSPTRLLTPLASDAKQALYDKLLASGLLDVTELDVLKETFWN